MVVKKRSLPRFVEVEAVESAGKKKRTLQRAAGAKRPAAAPKAVDGDLRSRGWVLTIFAGSQPDLLGAEERIRANGCSYFIFGRETCPETQRPHLQVYLYFFNQRKKQGIINHYFPYLPTVAVARGTGSENFVYCSKAGDFEEFGVRPLSPVEKGVVEKERWKVARDLAKMGDLESIEDELSIKYHTAFKSIAKDVQLTQVYPALAELRNLWIVGPAGCGKTSAIFNLFRQVDLFIKPLNKWWDGYKDQPVVLLDEMSPDAAKYLGMYVKLWSDRFPLQVEQKGLTRKIRPRHFVVCSNYSIAECFPNQSDLAPLLRRFHVIDFSKCLHCAFCKCALCRPKAYPQEAYDLIGAKVSEWGPLENDKVVVYGVQPEIAVDHVRFQVPVLPLPDVDVPSQVSSPSLPVLVGSATAEPLVTSVPACSAGDWEVVDRPWIKHKWFKYKQSVDEYSCTNCHMTVVGSNRDTLAPCRVVVGSADLREYNGSLIVID